MLVVALFAAPWGVAAPTSAHENGAVEPAIAESTGCGNPRAFPPLASHPGSLSDGEPVRGPFGAMFGRNVGQVRAAQVTWTVPMSGGLRVAVHQRVLPALQAVTANLEAARVAGLWYDVDTAAGLVGRTVAGKYSTSYHAVGAAIDINSAANPYREDNLLITDMPQWYVGAWASAGFCWGGLWLDKKDPMHFSWMGPVLTPGYGPVPAPYPPLSTPAPFPYVAASQPVVLGGANPDSTYHLADATGDGAIDALRLRPHAGGAVLEVAGSWADFTMCGFERWYLPGAPVGRPVILGGVGATGRPDVVFLDQSGANLFLTIYPAAGAYQQPYHLTTAVPSDPAATYLLADHNRDGRADLWVVRGPNLQVWDGASGFAATTTVALPVSGETHLTGDRDVDGLPDLHVIAGGQMTILSAASGFTAAIETIAMTVPTSDLLAMADYDGDGRDDLVRLDPGGTLSVSLGNQPIFSDIRGWFRNPELECPEDLPVYAYQGRFADDDRSPFQADIEWMATAGITQSCNPPFNDWYCPAAPVTRGQLAAFLARTLGLPAATIDAFGDDSGSPFEDSINRLAAAGITSGCGLGSFCPDAPLTRQEAATLLVRAFHLPSASTNPFTDTAGPHSADIAALAAAGVTAGCSPDGTLYCPFETVSREQVAVLLHRAAGP
jgi:hypothetical protein